MNTNNLKKKIEEKHTALEELLKQSEKEQKKLFLLRNKNKIQDLELQIAKLGEEIAGLEKEYNARLEKQKTGGKSDSFWKKHGLKFGVGFAAVFLAYGVHMYNKPLDIDGNRMTYRAMIDSFETKEIKSSDYTPETYKQYVQNLEDAEAQKNLIFMSDEEKLEYIEAVSSAYDALEPIPDKTALSSALNKAEAFDLSAYTPTSAKEFESAISEIHVVYDDSNATKKEVADAEAGIANAYLKLVFKADKTGLTELYDKYSALTLDEYTPSSVKSFKQELQKAKKVIDDGDALQDAVDKQIEEMQTIETLLVEKADKSALESMINACNALDRSNYKEGFDTLVSEVGSVSSLLSNDDISQAEVDSAVTRLETARNSLVEYTTYVYRVNMHAMPQYNDHVGSQLSYDRYYNGEYVHDGFEVSGDPGTYGYVEMQITEKDERPDIGYGSAAIYLQDGYQTSFDIIIYENGGRFVGNSAAFTVNVSVTFLRRE